MKRSSFPSLAPLTLMQAVFAFLLFQPIPAMADDKIPSQPVASGLPFLPASILGVIDKGHAVAYASRVEECVGFERSHRNTFNAYANVLAATAEEMKSLIASNDPNDQQMLDELKNFSTVCFESYQTEHLKPGQKYEKKVKALYPDCKGWFSKPADRILLHRWTNQLLRSVKSSNEAFADLAFAFKRLSREDIAGARDLGNQSSRIIKKAESMINDAYAGLRELKR